MMGDFDDLLRRVTVDPKVIGGKPGIRRTRVPVELVLALLAHGESRDTILEQYPRLEPDDTRACLAYAYGLVAHTDLEAVEVVDA